MVCAAITLSDMVEREAKLLANEYRTISVAICVAPAHQPGN